MSTETPVQEFHSSFIYKSQKSRNNQILISSIIDKQFAFLTSSQVVLMLFVQILYLENYYCREICKK